MESLWKCRKCKKKNNLFHQQRRMAEMKELLHGGIITGWCGYCDNVQLISLKGKLITKE